MVRLVGVDLPRNKKNYVRLTYIHTELVLHLQKKLLKLQTFLKRELMINHRAISNFTSNLRRRSRFNAEGDFTKI
jgi:hypothetical protein